MNPQSQKLVDDYLARLRQSLSALPANERDEAIAEVRTHIEEALTRFGTDEPDAVLRVLARLGAPEEYRAMLHDGRDTLEERLARLEQLTGISAITMKPGFDPVKFHQALRRYLSLIWLPFGVLMGLVVINMIAGRDVLSSIDAELFGVRLVATNNTPNYGGFAGVGIISVGGLAIGLLALGGGAIGGIACGGGAVGIVAIGGGACGLIAIGGGAFGYIAIGGGAFGVYALGGGGRGIHTLTIQRQDDEAIRFFTRFFPRIRTAFATGS